MKKHLIIAGIICAASIPPAAAVTKCVKLTTSTTCTSASGGYGQSNWSATCGGIEIQGVSFCGSQDGGQMGAISENVTTSSTASDNKHCWCKMVSPAVSRWVYYSEFSECANNCVFYCSFGVRNGASIRSALFGSLSD